MDIISIARQALVTEKFAAAIYSHLAAKYKDSATGKAFNEVSKMERRHISFWSDFLRQRGVDASTIGYNHISLAINKLLLRIIGKSFTLRIMENGENQAVYLYSSVLEGPGLSDEERKDMTAVIGDELVHEDLLIDEQINLGSVTAYIKDAVLGVSDGLVEILSVTTGLAGATGSPIAVAVSGLVVAVAGGVSMGISTYASTRSQRQVHEGTLKRVISASKFVGHVFKQRVLDHLLIRGYSNKISSEMAEETANNPSLLSSTVAEQEYGLKEENLGDPMKAALYAGLSNLLSGLIPLTPYFFISDIITALIVSILLAVVALAVTGFFVSILAYMPPGKKVGEMILTGVISAAITYGIGKIASDLLGTHV
jgi:VIT1/CCC1 family predicted Fe2+/Mn2+ transporter